MEKMTLQKFTELEHRIKSLFELEKISENDIKDFKDEERMIFEKYVVQELNKLNEDIPAREKIISKCEDVIFQTTKNQLWEMNHEAIKIAIIKYISEYGRMPTVIHITNETKLSRPTVYKHLREFENHKIYKDVIHGYKLMSSQVLAKVLKMAMNGDLRACKLYFDVVGGLAGIENNNRIGTQTNYIQINGIIFNEEKLKTLPPEQLKTIEAILLSSNLENAETFQNDFEAEKAEIESNNPWNI